MPDADIHKAGLGIGQKTGNWNQLLLKPTGPTRVKCYCEITIIERGQALSFSSSCGLSVSYY